MKGLEKLRKSIDDIDKSLVELFEKRMEVSFQIAKYKCKNKIPILDKGREEEIIKKNLTYLGNEKIKEETEEFLRNIMKISKDIQMEYRKSENCRY